MYWNNVETQPGMGYPRDCQNMGGGFDEEGALRLGRQPTVEDYGIPREYNVSEALLSGTDPWMRPNVKPNWGPNWDEDEGEGDYPNSYYFTFRACATIAPTRRAVSYFATLRKRATRPLHIALPGDVSPTSLRPKAPCFGRAGPTVTMLWRLETKAASCTSTAAPMRPARGGIPSHHPRSCPDMPFGAKILPSFMRWAGWARFCALTASNGMQFAVGW